MYAKVGAWNPHPLILNFVKIQPKSLADPETGFFGVPGTGRRAEVKV